MQSEKVWFNYRVSEIKYYLLTEGSGYPLADFNFPNLPVRMGARLVVPENRPQTANVFTESMHQSWF